MTQAEIGRYAQIHQGTVVNIVLIPTNAEIDLFGAESGHEAIVRVDLLEVQPCIGWVYNAELSSFSPPEEE